MLIRPRRPAAPAVPTCFCSLPVRLRRDVARRFDSTASEVWSRCPGSNWRPRPYQGRALPTELHRPSPLGYSRQVGPPILVAPTQSFAAESGLPTKARGIDSSASEGWSGRRGSNPRPTAWKAVTLPLSYSRLRARSAARSLALRRASPRPSHPRAAPLSPLRRVSPRPSHSRAAPLSPYGGASPNSLTSPPTLHRQRAQPSERTAQKRLVGRGGFEPP